MSETTGKTIIHPDLFGFYEGDGVAFLDHRATARVAVACGAIQTLTAVLMQREVDGSDTYVAENILKMDGRVAMGMLEAIACCAELVQMTVTGVGPESIGAVHLPSGSAGAELMRQTATRAKAMRRASDRRDA